MQPSAAHYRGRLPIRRSAKTSEARVAAAESGVIIMNEIRRSGLQLLTQNLGAVGMVRFLQQSQLGWGDYTKEHSQWLGNLTLDEIAAEIKAMRKSWPQPE